MQPILIVAIIFGLIFGPGRTEALTCMTALTYLLPCQPYLVENGVLTESCCHGVDGLRQDVPTSFKSHLCLCVKQAAASAKVDPEKVERLTEFCNVTLPLPINGNVDDCNWLRRSGATSKPPLLESEI